MKKRSFLSFAGCLVLMVVFTSIAAAQDESSYAGRFTFDIPAGWEVQEGADSVQVTMDGSNINIYGPDTYSSVLAGLTFETDAEALATFADRVGLEVGDDEAEGDAVPGELARINVELPRRDQAGFAVLLDVENGRKMVVASLGGEDMDPEAFDAVVGSLSYPADLIDVAMGNPDVSTLVAAVQAAGLEETLRGGSYTVFAPTNEAFEAALERLGMTAEEAMADPDTLATILSYHVVEGAMMAADLQPGELTTVQGDPIEISVRGDTMRVNNADVVATDMTAVNGVIHVIDTVLIPPDIEAPLIAAGLPELLERTKNYDDKLTFTYPVGIEPVVNADVAELREGNAAVLVYGPTVYQTVVGALDLPDAAEALSTFLSRVGGYEAGDAVTEGLGDNVLAASSVTLGRRGQAGTAYLVDLDNNRRSVVVTLAGREGFSLAVRDYVGNQVLGSLQYPPDLVDVAAATPELSWLVSAIEAAGLSDTLRDGEFTIFAPTNEAFTLALADLGMNEDDLLANTELLASILNYHVIEGVVGSADLVAGDVATVNGGNVTIALEDGVTVNGINVVTPDIEAANGVIHTIDGVLIPTLCAVSTDQADTVNKRVGPGSERGILGYLPDGVEINVTGQFTNESAELWYQIDKVAAAAPSSAKAVWVMASEVTVTGAGCSLVPVVEPS